MWPPKCNYVVEKNEPNLLIIRDVGPWSEYMSVTNGAEKVVEELYDQGLLGNKQLLCYDSEGQLDELKHAGPTFTGFAPGPK